MVIQKPCDNPGCVKGMITLFTSVKRCDKCGGTGHLYETTVGEPESLEDTATQMYKMGVDWVNGYGQEF